MTWPASQKTNLHYPQQPQENPQATVQIAHQQKYRLNVCAGIIDGHLIGTVYMPQGLNGRIYTFITTLENLPLPLRVQIWFMHDGAPPHFSIIARYHENNAMATMIC